MRFHQNLYLNLSHICHRIHETMKLYPKCPRDQHDYFGQRAGVAEKGRRSALVQTKNWYIIADKKHHNILKNQSPIKVFFPADNAIAFHKIHFCAWFEARRVLLTCMGLFWEVTSTFCWIILKLHGKIIFVSSKAILWKFRSLSLLIYWSFVWARPNS